MNLSEEYRGDNSRFKILPIPYESTVSYGKGTSKGPEAIIKASYDLEYYDIDTDSEPFENGIKTLEPLILPETSDNEKHQAMIYEKVKEIINSERQNNKSILISLGGEHSISFGIVKAFKEKYPDISILQLDAHLDLRDSFDDNRFSHACVMRRISELQIPFVQCGIRSMDIEEKYQLEKISTKIISMKEIHLNSKWMKEAIENLGENVYITIDVDCLDSFLMPATGTPEPDGMNFNQLLSFIREVIHEKNVRGIDIVEFSPIKGFHAYDYSFAKLIYQIIALINQK